jgi:hypothetical protein
MEVHRRGTQYGSERIAGNALQAVTLQPVFVLQISDAWFSRHATLNQSPERTRRSVSSSIVHAHSHSTFITVAAVAQVHMRLTHSTTDQMIDLL